MSINPLNELTPTEFISLFFDGLVSQLRAGSGCHRHTCEEVCVLVDQAQVMPAGSLVLLHGKQ